MRAEDPVPQVGDLPFPLVTRYADIVAVAADTETFVNRRTPDHPGYAAIDYFPMTHHVECVALLEKTGSDLRRER